MHTHTGMHAVIHAHVDGTYIDKFKNTCTTLISIAQNFWNKFRNDIMCTGKGYKQSQYVIHVCHINIIYVSIQSGSRMDKIYIDPLQAAFKQCGKEFI